MNIREASKSDIPQLLALMREVEADDTVNRKFITSFINKKQKCCFVAHSENRIAGYVLGHHKRRVMRKASKEAHLKELLVQDKHARDPLFDEFYTWAHNRGAKKINVTPDKENTKLVSFLKARGFKE